MTSGLAIILAAILILLTFFYLLSGRKSIEMKLVKHFIGKIKKYGYSRMPCEGLEEFAGRIDDLALREKALRFAAGFGAVYYRDRKLTKEERAFLKRLLDEL
jgi:hypothetical protein